MFEALSNGSALLTLFILLSLGALTYYMLNSAYSYLKKLYDIAQLHLLKEKHKEKLYEMKNLSEDMIKKLEELPLSLNEIIRKDMSLDEIEEYLDLYTGLTKKITHIHKEIADQAKSTNQKLNAAPGQNNNNKKGGNHQNQNQNQNQNQKQNNQEGKKNSSEDQIKKFIANQAKKALNTDDQDQAMKIAEEIIATLKENNFDLSNSQQAISALKNNCPELGDNITDYITKNYSS